MLADGKLTAFTFLSSFLSSFIAQNLFKKKNCLYPTQMVFYQSIVEEGGGGLKRKTIKKPLINPNTNNKLEISRNKDEYIDTLKALVYKY